MKKIISTLFVALFAAPIVALFLLLTGLVVSDLWEWFIVPIFGLEPLTFGQAIGLSLFLSFTCKHHKLTKTEEEKEKDWESIIKFFCFTLFCWLLSYVVHLSIN